jgi:hypothetical protein
MGLGCSIFAITVWTIAENAYKGYIERVIVLLYMASYMHLTSYPVYRYFIDAVFIDLVVIFII